jgi:hypothetical protein
MEPLVENICINCVEKTKKSYCQGIDFSKTERAKQTIIIHNSGTSCNAYHERLSLSKAFMTMSDSSSSPEPDALSSVVSTTIIAIDPVLKPSDILSSPKSSSSSSLLGMSPPNSLRHLMTSGSAMKSGRSSFPFDFDRLKAKAEMKASSIDSSSLDPYGYGYGYGPDESDKASSPSSPNPDELAGAKRRKFQRRNSKTPAMLMMMNSSSLLHLDFLEDKKEHDKSQTTTTTTTMDQPSTFDFTSAASASNFDSWDGGMEIAESLVKQVMHLHKRKKSSQP